MLAAAVVLAALVFLAAASGRTGLPGVLALGAVSVLWFVVNGPVEIAVLWVVAPHHGLTVADLAGVAGLGVAAWRAGQWWRRRGASQER